MVYQSEKTIADLGDKITPNDKDELEGRISALKEALKGTDTDMIKAAADGLTAKFGEVSQKLYAQAAPQGDPNAAGGAQGGTGSNAGGDQFYDADFKDVSDDQ